MCISVYVYVCVCICVHGCACVYVHVYVCMRTRVCVYVRACCNVTGTLEGFVHTLYRPCYPPLPPTSPPYLFVRASARLQRLPCVALLLVHLRVLSPTLLPVCGRLRGSGCGQRACRSQRIA
jgi:hypothetical protein